ncbi:hypothetical protein BDA96_02G237100 [Sorghum bicolor]|uniref:Uncharacterized protein n=1 Tax=Sorghum bicolor TaxID=4558 RepID=A0A921RPV4_SORBI|nr:hypothetical protein BDA96_02G237100 [Sorghum bicolor]
MYLAASNMTSGALLSAFCASEQLPTSRSSLHFACRHSSIRHACHQQSHKKSSRPCHPNASGVLVPMTQILVRWCGQLDHTLLHFTS